MPIVQYVLPIIGICWIVQGDLRPKYSYLTEPPKVNTAP